VATTACSTAEREQIEIITAEECAWLAEAPEVDQGVLEGMGDEELKVRIKEYGEKIARLEALRSRVIEQCVPEQRDGPG
jgi:hypothetical protein